jgi:hypothetical protein
MGDPTALRRPDTQPLSYNILICTLLTTALRNTPTENIALRTINFTAGSATQTKTEHPCPVSNTTIQPRPRVFLAIGAVRNLRFAAEPREHHYLAATGSREASIHRCDPGVVNNFPVSSSVFSPDRIIIHPPKSWSFAPSRS